jgi:hypothetical protein
MIIITFCDNIKNQNYQLLKKNISIQKYKFVNLFTGNNPFNGFFNRWLYISNYLKIINENEDVVILDGLDMFLIGSLENLKKEIRNGIILYGMHNRNQRLYLKNTCNRNCGILIGKAKNILELSGYFVKTSQEQRKFFKDCDQSYFNYMLNNSLIPQLIFKNTHLIYMNNDEVDPKFSVFYHAIGMNDFYLLKTKKRLAEFGIKSDLKLNLKRYFSYLSKWFQIELKIFLNICSK